MTSWMRDNLVPVLVIMAALMAAGTVSGWIGTARATAVAEMHEATADSLQRVADSERRANAALSATIDSMAETYSADSASWAEQNAENAARIASLTRSAQATASALRERLDSVGTALFAEYEAQTDSIIAAKDEQIADLQAERASLWEQRESMASLVRGLGAEADGLRAINAELRAANAARAQSTSLWPDFGSFTKPVYIIGGMVLGYTVAEVAGGQ